VLDTVLDLSVPIYEGMPVDDLGPKVRLSHAASRPLYQYTQSREGHGLATGRLRGRSGLAVGS
jgi:hypothetical protein